MGNKPDYKILERNADGKWKRVGAGWDTDRGGVSLSLGEQGEAPRKFLLVKNDYEQKESTPGSAHKSMEKEQEEMPLTISRPDIDDLDDSIPF